MTQVIANNINTVFSYRDRIFQILIVGIMSLSFLYVYFLQNVISNVVEREKIVKENRVLGTTVSELEAKYFTIKNSINIELANAKGFKSTEITSYISKGKITAMANQNGI